MTHVSTGGGASLEYLEGRVLPGVAALNNRGTSNMENRFTGWTDVDLSERGFAEAHRAGHLLKAEGQVRAPSVVVLPRDQRGAVV